MDKKEYIKSKIRDIKDFPKEGIIFKDITPLLMDVKAGQYVIDLLVENLHGQKIDKVVGMESRGFFFGMLLAQRLGAGFVPVRKKGKLTNGKRTKTYGLVSLHHSLGRVGRFRSQPCPSNGPTATR